jgi:hypothetical protein
MRNSRVVAMSNRTLYINGNHSIILETSWEVEKSDVILPPSIDVYCHPGSALSDGNNGGGYKTFRHVGRKLS